MKERTHGKIIAFYGIDGSGKTTVIPLVKKHLEREGSRVAIFRNHVPSSRYWKAVKNIERHCNANGHRFSYELDRFIQVLELAICCEEELPDLLDNHDMVLSDRYILDKLIYGELRGDMGIARVALGALRYPPDLGFFLDVSVKTATQRIEEKGGSMDWKEQPGILMKARDAYHAYFATAAETVVRIDAERPINEVVTSIVDNIMKKMVCRDTILLRP